MENDCISPLFDFYKVTACFIKGWMVNPSFPACSLLGLMMINKEIYYFSHKFHSTKLAIQQNTLIANTCKI
jgi:hypothetical protein